MANLPEPIPLDSSPEAFEALLTCIAGSFAASGDPLERYLTAYEQRLSNATPISLPKMVDTFRHTVTTSVSQHAQVMVIPSIKNTKESPSFAAAAVWVTPSHPRGPRAVTPESTPPFVDYHLQSEANKVRVLGKRPRYYYIHILARAVGDETKGAVSSLLRWGMDRARRDGVPVYLEASNPHSRDVYTHFGFRVCGEVVIGKGEVDEKGLWVDEGKNAADVERKSERRDAPGVCCWCMIWEPEETGRDA